MNCSLSEKNSQNRSHNVAASCAQKTTTSKLVRQNASGIHKKFAISRVSNEKFYREAVPLPDPSPGREGETPSPPIGAFGASILAPLALDQTPERNEN